MSLIQIAETFGVTEAGLSFGQGPTARRRRLMESQQYRSTVVNAAKMLSDAWAGDRLANMAVHEALSTSDLFKSAAGDVMDREMLRQYDVQPVQWTKIAAQTLLKDFRPKFLREMQGARARLERVPELTEYPSSDYTVTEKSIQVGKYGRRFGYSWEAGVNDELGELQLVPGEFATGARLTEDYAVLSQLANPVTGAMNTAFFNAGNGNAGTKTLTPTNLQQVLTDLGLKRDANGNQLVRPALRLVVGPALEFTARNILATTQIKTTVGGVEVFQPNPLAGSVSLEVLANLPGTNWFILPDPGSGRPAFYLGKLRGYETPDLRYKNDQGVSVGGGTLGPAEGSFDIDAVYWRVRHVVGAAAGDPTFTYASSNTVA